MRRCMDFSLLTNERRLFGSTVAGEGLPQHRPLPPFRGAFRWPEASPIRPSCPDLLIRALAEGSVAVIHGNSLQANAAAGLERGECQTQLKSGW